VKQKINEGQREKADKNEIKNMTEGSPIKLIFVFHMGYQG